MRELSRRAFPEPDVVAHDTPASIAAALRRARAERAARQAGTAAAVQQSTELPAIA
ncbi:hypothetical protein [Streptomyces flaveolus]|uniref:hypothetical protein n=1 Tax=Streptomyces flaveolus TaxID=67297 RepID=UPI003F5681BC